MARKRTFPRLSRRKIAATIRRFIRAIIITAIVYLLGVVAVGEKVTGYIAVAIVVAAVCLLGIYTMAAQMYGWDKDKDG